MATDKLHQNDAYLAEADAVVTAIRSEKAGISIATDRTVFFPEGGGQPSDVGELGGVKILHAKEENGIVFHLTDLANESELPFKTGDTLHAKIDWDFRFENMQRHAGEHLLSGVFHALYGGYNRGFHMGKDFITADISLEGADSPEKITWEMAMTAEERINEIIWSAAPITITTFASFEEAKRMPLRKELTIEDEEITVVTIGNTRDPFDCVACCGTHPHSTAEIGLLKIYKVEKNKGMYRIYFDAGRRAMQAYRSKHELLTQIGNHFSAGDEDLWKKLTAEEQKNAEVHSHMNDVIRTLAGERAEEILTFISEHPGEVCYRKYDDFTSDDIMKIGKQIIPQAEKPVLLLSQKENTVLLFSNGEINCGTLVRENAGIYGGKGGGSDTTARAIFPAPDDIDTFADLIEKHLRD